MRINLEDKVSDLLLAHGFDCGAISEPDGRFLIRIGAFKDEECVDALVREFYDPQTVIRLARYLVGKLQPQMMGIGDVVGFRGLLPDGRIVGVFGRRETDARESYARGQRMWQELVETEKR